MDLTTYDRYRSDPPRTPADRAHAILDAIRTTQWPAADHPNQTNVRHLQGFFDYLGAHYPTDRFRLEQQPIPRRHIRTTDRNFVVTVPGRSPGSIVLVAHYDTWAGFSRHAPGADDNSTGEEMLKQYLLRDLARNDPPPLTHVYLFAGSEECGTRGLLAQLGITVILSLTSIAISASNPYYLLAAIPFLPFLSYRFGVTGTYHFVQSLGPEEKATIRAAIAVDSVGEGRLYIPENEMGANFIRAILPYEGSEHLNDLLEEGAHLNGIKYNRFLSGGTTDSVVFLEERVRRRGSYRVRRGSQPRGRGEKDPQHIPAAALITMAPGKCSPFVLGGKLHTKDDTPDRIFPEPLAETLTVLDYAIDILEGGDRPSAPRDLHCHHHARLYRDGEELFLAVKDIEEANGRNINSIFRVKGEIEGSTARLQAGEVAWWGVETKLDKEMTDFRPDAVRVNVDLVEVDGSSDGNKGSNRDTDAGADDHASHTDAVGFEARSGPGRRLAALWHGLVGFLERQLGRYSFLAMFATALGVAFATNALFELAIDRSDAVAGFFVDHFILVTLALVAFQLAAVFRLFTRELPTWMDNCYRHENAADNLTSLYRAGVPEVLSREGPHS